MRLLRIVLLLLASQFSYSLFADCANCAGAWAYRTYAACEDKSFGVAAYNRQRSEHCGVENYHQKAAPECGVSQHNEGRGEACGVELYNEAYAHPCPRHSAKCHQDGCSTCNEELGQWCKAFSTPWGTGCVCTYIEKCRHESFGVERYNSCRHSDFGAEQYNTCRHSSFGVEAYNECEHQNHGVKKYKTGRGAVCGLEVAVHFTKHLSQIANYALHLLNDQTSACTTCDDLGTGNKEEVQKRFTCLKAALQNAELAATGYNCPDLAYVINELYGLQVSHSAMLNDEQNSFIFSLLENYPGDFKC